MCGVVGLSYGQGTWLTSKRVHNPSSVNHKHSNFGVGYDKMLNLKLKRSTTSLAQSHKNKDIGLIFGLSIQHKFRRFHSPLSPNS